jgi:ATP phosphoribosyltransferase regulatory subunit
VSAADKVSAVLAAQATLALDPPVLQPAALYLELAGEGLRKRAFMVEDPHGQDLCLRPDMTVPACRAALDLPEWRAAFAVRYQGLVFRRRDALNAGAAEFIQAGAEWFAPAGEMNAREPAIVAAAVEACRSAGAEPMLRLGDVGVFAALVRSLGLPPHWSERLVRAFSRAGGPQGVINEAMRPARAPSPLAQRLAGMSAEGASAALADVLADQGIELFGGRNLEEITARLRAEATHAHAPRPDPAALANLGAALEIEDAPDAALAKLARFESNGGPLGAALARLEARWTELQRLAKPNGARFALNLGRGISYYDGFVFELEAPALGPRANLGGGGRYDGLIHALAAAENKQNGAKSWAAAGFALRPKRVADAAS